MEICVGRRACSATSCNRRRIAGRSANAPANTSAAATFKSGAAKNASISARPRRIQWRGSPSQLSASTPSRNVFACTAPLLGTQRMR